LSSTPFPLFSISFSDPPLSKSKTQIPTPQTHTQKSPHKHNRLQQYAREARAEYATLGDKDLGQLKVFVKGLPKLAVLDRLTGALFFCRRFF